MAEFRSVQLDGTFEDVLTKASPEIREISRRLRTLVSEVLPGATEVPWKRMRIASYGVGPKKMSEHFCYIAPQTKHVNFGFYYGAELDAPAGLLEGTGKSLRHVKIRSIGDAENPVLKDLLKRSTRYLPRLSKRI